MKNKIFLFIIIVPLILCSCASPMPRNPQEKLEQNHWILKSEIDNQGELYFKDNKIYLSFTPSEKETKRTPVKLVCDYYIQDDKITVIVPQWGQNIELYYKINGKELTLTYLGYEIVMEFI